MGWADLGAKRLDVLHPSVVFVDLIGRETDDLYATGSKVWGTAGDFAELSGANRGKIVCKRGSVSSKGLRWKKNPTGMGEEDGLCARKRRGASVLSTRSARCYQRTHESPIQSWNLIGPTVVSASKSGAMFPRRKDGMVEVVCDR